jgi:hypothetical protein
MEKYGTARQTIDYNIIRRKRFACWIIKDTDTYAEYVIIIIFHGKNGYANAPQYDAYSYIAFILHNVFIPQSCGSLLIFFNISSSCLRQIQPLAFLACVSNVKQTYLVQNSR